MNKISSREEAVKQLEFMKSELPKHKRLINDVLRMIDLAKQSPRAALNQDFIDRVEQTWTFRKQDLESQEKMVEELIKIVDLVQSPQPPTTPPPLKPIS